MLFLDTFCALLATFIIKKFIIDVLIESKLLNNWCNKQDEIYWYLRANVSREHPRVKQLLKEEEEIWKKLVEHSPYLEIK